MIEIQWGSFFLVAAVALISAGVLAGFYAGGVRLLSTAQETGRPAATAAAYACFAVCIAAVLFGLWLVVPQFH
jgi:hypothetical protein